MGKRIRAALLGTSLTVSVAFGGAVIFGTVQNCKISQARKKEVKDLVAEFKGCPERLMTQNGCHTPREKLEKIAEAKKHEKDGNYEKAGLAYIEMAMENEAREMAGLCSDNNDDKGKNSILDKLAIREEAVKKAKKELKEEKEKKK